MTPWLAAGLVVILLNEQSVETGPAHAQLLASTLAMALGITAFWQHGGRQITAAGVYSFASAVFVGGAGLYWWAVDRATCLLRMPATGYAVRQD